MAHQVKVLIVPADLGLPGIAKVTTVNTIFTLSDDQFATLSPRAFTDSPPMLQDLGYIGPGAVSVQAAYTAPAPALTSAQESALTSAQDAAITSTTLALTGTYSADYAGLNTDFNALRTDVSTLRTEYNAAQVDLVTARTNFNELQTDVAAIRTALNNLLTALQVPSGPQAA
jgi:hypothetical protein